MTKGYHYYLTLTVKRELESPYQHQAYYVSDELVGIPYGPDAGTERYDQRKRVCNEMRKAIVAEFAETQADSILLNEYQASIYGEVYTAPMGKEGSIFKSGGFAAIDLTDPTRIIPGNIPIAPESTRTTPSVSMNEFRDRAPSHHFSGLGTVRELEKFTTKIVEQESRQSFTNDDLEITIEEYGEGQSIRAKACIGVFVCFVACVATIVPAALIQADLIASAVPAIALFGVGGAAFVAGIVCLGLIIHDKCRERRVRESMFGFRLPTATVTQEIELSEHDSETGSYKKI